MSGPHGTTTRYPHDGRGGAMRWRIIAFAVSVALTAVVVVAVVGNPLRSAECSSSGPLTAVRGIIGSEKKAFFDDERVRAAFACAGLAVTVESAGSREMPARLNTAPYDFAFPSSSPTAEKIMRDRKIAERYAPFSSPMAVATFTPIVAVLTRVGIVRGASDGTQVVDIAKLIEFVRKGTRWDQLPGNVEYPARKAVLISTTHPKDSNSAIMYLAIASHVANDSAVVTTADAVQRVLPDLCRLIVGQGYKSETTQVLFNSYLVDGMGRTPMALIYEAEFVATVSKPNLTPDRVLLYPSPTVYSRHTVVPLDDAGHRVGKALRDDLTLARLAAEHGFRPERPTDRPVSYSRPPIDVVEPPSFEVLESMITVLAPASGEPCAGVVR
jgi:hypothetical protein